MSNQVIEVKTAEQRQKDQIRQAISKLVDEYAALEFAPKSFTPGSTVIPPSGKLIDGSEIKNKNDYGAGGKPTFCAHILLKT